MMEPILCRKWCWKNPNPSVSDVGFRSHLLRRCVLVEGQENGRFPQLAKQLDFFSVCSSISSSYKVARKTVGSFHFC